MADEIQSKSGTIISLFSTASSVGKTIIAVNLAAGLAAYGKKVLLADCDMQFGDVANMLSYKPQKTIADVQAAFLERPDVDLLPLIESYSYNTISFGLLTAPLRLDQAYNMKTDALKKIFTNLRRHYDFIIIDTTTAFNELNMAILDMSTYIAFIGIVDFIPTIKNMKIGYDAMRRLGYDQEKIHFILNRDQSHTSIDFDDVQNILGTSFQHIIPNDFQTVQASIKEHVPLILAQKNAPVAEKLEDLVQKFIQQTDGEKEGQGSGLGSIFKRLFR